MRNFNSRPHEEVDLAAAIPDMSEFDISTHDLTRRSTDKGGSTEKWQNSFQLTTSRGGRLVLTAFEATASAFQLTTSRGGRPGTA